MMKHKYIVQGRRKARVDLHRVGVFTRSYQILSHITDQVTVIPMSDWPKHEGNAEILGEILIHKIVETPVIREIRYLIRDRDFRNTNN